MFAKQNIPGNFPKQTQTHVDRKTSIDQPTKITTRASVLSEFSKLNKISIPRAFDISQIEGWEAKPSEDGTKISLQLNINFNLKAILVGDSMG